MKVLNSYSVIGAGVLLSDLASGFSLFGSKESRGGQRNQLRKRNGEKVDDYVKFEFAKSYGDSFENSSRKKKPFVNLVKRSEGYEEIEILNESSFYSIELSIGTPAQNVTVLVDTGSSDLWVTGSNNPFCGSSSHFTDSQGNLQSTIDCTEYGVFDTSKSSTYKSNDTGFSITYADYSFAEGTWSQDVLVLEDVDVSGLSFAVANYSNSTVGVLGIGLQGLEVTYSGYTGSRYGQYQYANFPVVLKDSGVIQATAYSLYLDQESSEYGSVLFGAVDHSKYTGTLYTIPLINTLKSAGFPTVVEFDITLQGLGMSNSTHNITFSDTQVPALLDSGTTLTYLPQNLLDIVIEELGATFSSRLGLYTMRCPTNDSDTEIVFDFGGFHIAVNINNFLLSSSMNVCVLGLLPQAGNSCVFGDSFLQSAYVVYDLDNLEISMAQAKYDSDDEQIEIISSAVPSAVRAASYSNTWSTTVTTFTKGGNIFTLTDNNEAVSASASASQSSSSAASRSSSRSSSSTSSSRSDRSSASSLRPASSTITTVSSHSSGSSSSSGSISNTATSVESGKKENDAYKNAPSFMIILAFLFNFI